MILGDFGNFREFKDNLGGVRKTQNKKKAPEYTYLRTQYWMLNVANRRSPAIWNQGAPNCRTSPRNGCKWRDLRFEAVQHRNSQAFISLPKCRHESNSDNENPHFWLQIRIALDCQWIKKATKMHLWTNFSALPHLQPSATVQVYYGNTICRDEIAS